MIIPPDEVPELGFYYNHNHDPNGTVNNHAYEVVGVGADTEKDGVFMVVYRPLYNSTAYSAGKFFDLKLLEKWMGDVTKDGVTQKRYTRIVDPYIIDRLIQIKEVMY